MKQKDIVLINFPFTSFENSKTRPAVVISNERFNNGANIILLAISTKKGNEFYSTPLVQGDLVGDTLQRPCFVRYSNVLSIEKRLTIRKLGRLKDKKFAEIVGKLKSFIE